jgi:hypothetical protein
MFGAELLCSDEACALIVEGVGSLAGLELMVCDDCGCTLQITSVWEVREVRLPPPVEELPLAA